MDVTKRLLSLRRRAGLSRDQLAAELGFGRGTSLRYYEVRGKDGFKGDSLQVDLVSKLIDVLVGRGAPPITADEVAVLAKHPLNGMIDLNKSDYNELTYEPLDEHNKRGVSSGEPYPSDSGASPEVDARAGAGRGQLGQEIEVAGLSGHRVIDEWVLPRRFHQEIRTQAGFVWVIQVRGNSMEPLLQDGDRVLVDTTQTTPSPDGVYVFDDGGGPEVKELQRVRGSDPQKVDIISANKDYSTSRVPLDQIRIVGRVVAAIRRI